jgi:hypothetical protein
MLIRHSVAITPDLGNLRSGQQLPILVGMDLVALCKVRTVPCSRTASSAIFAFSPTSIRRLVFFAIARSIYQTERPLSNPRPGPKIRVHFNRRPARTFVLPAPRVPDGLTISPVPFRKQPDNETPMISYRIIARSSE